jgi:hypothetical protein
VFTASGGDPINCHILCETLATPERAVSPTRFTNSVHNAAAGYWHIAAASTAASTSLGAFDDSFEAGLIEAMSQCAAGHTPVLLVAADQPYPEPLHAKRPLADVFALGLLLKPGAGACSLQLGVAEDGLADACCDDAGLDSLRLGVPAARALPLLQAIARGATSTWRLAAWAGMALGVSGAAPVLENDHRTARA